MSCLWALKNLIQISRRPFQSTLNVLVIMLSDFRFYIDKIFYFDWYAVNTNIES